MSDEVRFVSGLAATVGGVLITGTTFGLAAPVGGALIMLGTGQMRQALFPNRMSNERQWQNQQSPIGDLVIVYGEARVGARVADSRIDSTGRLHRVYCFALGSENGKGIEAVMQVFLDGSQRIQGFPIAPGQGPLTAGVSTYYTVDGNDQLFYSLHLGSDTQVVDSMMNGVNAGAWPATSKGLGVAYMVLRMNDHEVFDRIPAVTAKVRGVRVYDPRDVTGGPDGDGYIWDKADATAGQAYNPGQNNALQVLDYLRSERYGLGAPLSEISVADFIVEADYHDGNVSDGDIGNQARFQGDGWISTADQLSANIDALLASCRGELIYEQGLWRLHTRKPAGPVTLTLNEDNIIGDWEFWRAGASEAPNRMVSRFPWEGADFKTSEVEWPKYTVANPYLIVDDNVENLIELDLPMTTNWVRAEQITMVMLKTVREDAGFAVMVDPSVLELRVGDVVPVDHQTPGWSGKEFEIIRADLLPDGNVRVTCREHDDDAYSLDAQVLPPSVPGSDLADPTTVIAPTSLVLTSDNTTIIEHGDGSLTQQVNATWTRSLDPFLKYEEVLYQVALSGTWIPWKEVWPTDVEEVNIGPVETGVRIDVKVEAVNTRGLRSTALTGFVTPGAKTDPAITPTSIVVKRAVSGGWWFRVFVTDVIDTLAYELRWQFAVEAADWSLGTQVSYGFVKWTSVEWQDMPVATLRIMAKAINNSGVESTGFAEVTIINGPPNVGEVDYVKDEMRRRKADIFESRYANDLADDTGLITRIDAATGEIEDLYYGDLGPDLNLREPSEQGSQINTETNVYQRKHQQTITVATGAQIIRVRHLSGGLSVQGGSKWGTKLEVDDDTAISAPPATYHQQPVFAVDGEVITPQLYLAEAATPTQRTAAFTPDNTASGEGDATDNSTPATADVPADNDTYSADYSLTVGNDGSGSFLVSLSLQVKIDGAGLWLTINRRKHTATFGAGGGSQVFAGTFVGVKTGIAGGNDIFRVLVFDTTPVPSSAVVTVQQLTWTESVADYASMTPNDELSDIEVVTIPPE